MSIHARLESLGKRLLQSKEDAHTIGLISNDPATIELTWELAKYIETALEITTSLRKRESVATAARPSASSPPPKSAPENTANPPPSTPPSSAPTKSASSANGTDQSTTN